MCKLVVTIVIRSPRLIILLLFFFFSSRRRHTRSLCDWSSDVCSSDLARPCVKHYHAAIELYRDGRHPDQPGPAKFRRDYSISGAEPILVRMIGAWDTVGALGIPLRGFRSLTHARYQFHDTELSDIVQYAC